MVQRHRNLIIGLSGIGKTTLVEHMQARGYWALDGDLIEGLGVWRTADGEQAAYQSSRAWRANHNYSWDGGRLAEVLFSEWPSNENRPLYLFGTAPQIEHHSFWFHNIVVLQASAETIYRRLTDPARRTPYPYEINQSDLPALEGVVSRFRFLATRCLGYTAIDAEPPVAEVADEIVLQCQIPHSSPRPQPPMPLAEILHGLA